MASYVMKNMAALYDRNLKLPYGGPVTSVVKRKFDTRLAWRMARCQFATIEMVHDKQSPSLRLRWYHFLQLLSAIAVLASFNFVPRF